MTTEAMPPAVSESTVDTMHSRRESSARIDAVLDKVKKWLILIIYGAFMLYIGGLIGSQISLSQTLAL